MKNPTLFFLFILCSLANLLDGITAYFILPGEFNPLVNYMGYFPSLLIKFGLIPMFYFLYVRKNRFPDNFSLYFGTSLMMLMIVLFSLGAYSNIATMNNPEILAEAALISDGEKTTQYFSLMGFIVLPIYLFQLLSFKVYEWSRKKVIIDKQYFDKWWKI